MQLGFRKVYINEIFLIYRIMGRVNGMSYFLQDRVSWPVHVMKLLHPHYVFHTNIECFIYMVEYNRG